MASGEIGSINECSAFCAANDIHHRRELGVNRGKNKGRSRSSRLVMGRCSGREPGIASRAGKGDRGRAEPVRCISLAEAESFVVYAVASSIGENIGLAARKITDQGRRC